MTVRAWHGRLLLLLALAMLALATPVSVLDPAPPAWADDDGGGDDGGGDDGGGDDGGDDGGGDDGDDGGGDDGGSDGGDDDAGSDGGDGFDDDDDDGASTTGRQGMKGGGNLFDWITGRDRDDDDDDDREAERNDHERALKARRAGSIAPLRSVMASVQRRYGGTILDARLVSRKGRTWYEIRLLDRRNRLRSVQVPASGGGRQYNFGPAAPRR